MRHTALLVTILFLFRPAFGQSLSPSEAKDRLRNRGVEISRSSFEYSVSNGDSSRTALLLEAGFDPNRRLEILDVDADLYPLWIAASSGHVGVVRALLSHGASTSATSLVDTPLHAAVGHPDVVRVLIQHGASVHSISEAGMMPIHSTLLSKDTTWIVLNESLRILLTNGADPNAEAQGGQLKGANALLISALAGRPRAAQILINHGAEPDLTMKGHERREGPLSRIAREAGNEATAEALEKAGM